MGSGSVWRTAGIPAGRNAGGTPDTRYRDLPKRTVPASRSPFGPRRGHLFVRLHNSGGGDYPSSPVNRPVLSPIASAFTPTRSSIDRNRFVIGSSFW